MIPTPTPGRLREIADTLDKPHPDPDNLVGIAEELRALADGLRREDQPFAAHSTLGTANGRRAGTASRLVTPWVVTA